MPGHVDAGMRYHRVLGLIVAALLSEALAGVATAQPAQPAEMRPVQDPGGRFSISFPGDWRVEKSPDGKPSVIGIAPSKPSDFHVNVNVVVETLPSALTPQSYAQASGRQLALIFHDYTVIQEGPMQVGGRSAYYRYYTWVTNSGISVYQVQVYFTVGLTGFVVTGSTINDPDRIRTDLPVIARVIETFRLSGDVTAGASSR
jgi:hypothetical protein